MLSDILSMAIIIIALLNINNIKTFMNQFEKEATDERN